MTRLRELGVTLGVATKTKAMSRVDEILLNNTGLELSVGGC